MIILRVNSRSSSFGDNDREIVDDDCMLLVVDEKFIFDDMEVREDIVDDGLKD